MDGLDLSNIISSGARTPRRIVLADAWVDLAGELVTNKVMATDGQFQVVRDRVSQTTHTRKLGAAMTAEETVKDGTTDHLRGAIETYLEWTGAHLRLTPMRR